MSYYPPARPYYQGGYYTGEYADYGSYYASYGGGYPRPPPARGAWRGGRGGWSGGRGGSSGGSVRAAQSVSSSPTAAAVKTEPASPAAQKTAASVAQKTAAPAATVKSEPGAVPNGSASVAPAAGQTTTTSATGTRTTAATAASAGNAAANKTPATADAAAKTTVDTPLSDDHPFPESATEKFFPNRCELCSVVFPVAKDIFIPEKGGLSFMDNNLQSTMHYSGKCHKKKLRQFMQDYCRKNRIILPRKARELMKDTPAIPKTQAQEAPKVDLYCKTCDLSFTSQQHASQHYAGRNHQRKVEGKPPLKTGYFNPKLGRWQRMPPGKEDERYSYPYRPPASLLRAIPPAPAPADPSVVTVKVSPGNLVNAGVKPVTTGTAGAVAQSKFHCDMCGVSATCQLQLDTHMTGARHKLMAKKLGVPVPAAKPATSEAASANTAAEPAAKKPRRDYSIYKTPSGKFYCLPCNLTLNSETQFAQHFESKKHQTEVARQRKAGVTSA